MAIKTLFVGSNWEALATLKTLHEDERFEIVGVITQPDKPVGRKQEILPTEIKLYCNQAKIPVFHTESKPENYKLAAERFSPELIVCKSFGEIIPGFFLEAPKYKAINVHYSLLPLYRGAVPIQKAILNGDKNTGITIVQMVEKLDAGPILAQFTEEIRDDDTNQTLRERLVKLTQEKLPDILEQWCNGEIAAKPQDDSKATYCWQKDISKDSAEIIFANETAENIDRKIRALLPWPVAWTMFDGKRLKIFEAKLISTADLPQSDAKYKESFIIANQRLFAKTKSSGTLLEILELQIEGKSRFKAEEFVNGYK